MHPAIRLPLLATLLATARAQVINVDVNSGTANHYSGAGLVPGDTGTTWNGLNIGSNQTSVTIPAGSVKDSRGNTLPGVSIGIASSNGTSAIGRFSSTGGPMPNPEALMRDYTYNGTYNVTVSGLAAGTYKFWYFGHGNANSQAGTVTVNAANGGGTGSTANSALGRDLINGGPGVSYVYLADRTVDATGTFRFQVANFLNGFQLANIPEITSQPPAAATAVVGTGVSLAVTAKGGALTYQWHKGGTSLAEGPSGSGSTLSGTTGPILTLANPQLADAGEYTVVVTNSGGSVTSMAAVLTVSPTGAPYFLIQPVGRNLMMGEAATLDATVTGNLPLALQWQKSTDGGTTFADIAGENSPSYILPVGKMSAAGRYRLVAANSLGTATSATVMVSVNPAYAPLVPDGFGASATGGGNLTPVVVTTAAALKSLAEATAPAVITISGTINLGGNVRVKSNKTIQGIDADSGVIGNVLLRDVNNVILRGLNFTHPGTTIGSDGKYTDGGDGVSVDTSTNVFVTHCTFTDCADGMIDTRLGSTGVTISWCKLYYTSATTPHHFTMIADGNVLRDPVTDEVIGAGVPLRMTMHHNWWADYCDQRMPSSTNAMVHMFNNYWNTPGNYYAALARSGSQFISEQNRCVGVNNPLSKSVTDADLPNPLIRSIGNSYSSCTGAIDAGTDLVFTPPYSYPLNPAANVEAVVRAFAGNTAGAASSHPPPAAGASIAGPPIVGTGGGATLTAVAAGFTPVSWQWRFRNANLGGATSAALQIANAQGANAGSYSVVLGLAGGESVVSSAFDLQVLAGAPVITSQPVSQSVAVGAPVTFKVTATGTPSPTYQWYRNGSPVPGATGASYTIPSATGGSVGSYTVAVTNSIASIASDAAALAFSDPLANYALGYGLDPATNGAAGADPDRDGLANVVEFLLGGNPVAGEVAGLLPTVGRAGGTAVFRFNIAKAAAGVSWSVETSGSPQGAWTPAVHGAGGVTITKEPLDASRERVTVTVPAAAGSLFARLRVSNP